MILECVYCVMQNKFGFEAKIKICLSSIHVLMLYMKLSNILTKYFSIGIQCQLHTSLGMVI